MPWVDGLTFTEVLAQTANKFPDHDALIFPQFGYHRTYREFRSDVEESARALMAIGVESGEHIGVWATNRPQWVELQFAAASMGAVLVNINPAYRAHELEYVLNQADITTLFLIDQFKSSSFFDVVGQVCPELSQSWPGELRAKSCPRLRHVISVTDQKTPGMMNWDQFRSRADLVLPSQLEQRQASLRSGDVVNIQYTSGTTGFPKGAMLTHRNLLLNAFYVGQRIHFAENDRLCIPVPFYHCFGCVLGTLMCAVYGSAMVIPSESFDALATLKAVQEERCTGLYGVPTMFIAELNHTRFSEFDLSLLRTGVMAGSPCPIEVMRQVIDKMGTREITIAYGLTETSPVITQTEAAESIERRISTVGKPLPGLEVRIAKPGTIEALPSGEAGELVTRGHCVMRGYYKKEEETNRAITPEGWLHTGDLAMKTSDGYYRITGRIKDMIIRGGENIYPREIEEYLYTHPKVADVQVVGLPDEEFGEEVCAWIRVKAGVALTEAEVTGYCKGQIAHYKIPRYVIFVDEYPATVTGKVQKYKLRELGIERLGLQKAASVETA